MSCYPLVNIADDIGFTLVLSGTFNKKIFGKVKVHINLVIFFSLVLAKTYIWKIYASIYVCFIFIFHHKELTRQSILEREGVVLGANFIINLYCF